jgi:P27 family predicted phage terminase small subunit
MGQRGPLPKPTARKRLEGNPGHRTLPTDEPEPRLLVEIPSPPGWLPPMACDAWRMVTRELHSAEMLAALDLPILEMFCIAYHSWRQMVDEVKRCGYTQEFFDNDGNLKYSQPTPAATLLSKFQTNCNQLAKVLGLGPAYRVGLRVGDGKDGTSPVDPIAAMLAGQASSKASINPPPKRAKKAVKKPTKPKKPKA